MNQNVEKNPVLVVCDSYYLAAKNGEYSSRSPSPNHPLKGFNLFRAISRKIGRRIRQSKQKYKSTSSDDEEESNLWSNSVLRTPKKSKSLDARCECHHFYGTDKDSSGERRNERNSLKFSEACKRHNRSSGSDTCSSSNDDSFETSDAYRKGKRSDSTSNESSASSSSSAESFKQANAHVSKGDPKGIKGLNTRSRSLSCFSITQMKEIAERRESVSKDKRPKKSPQKILRQPATHTYVRGISGLPTVQVSMMNKNGYYNRQYSRG